MKTVSFLFYLLFTALIVSAQTSSQEYQKWIKEAESYYQQKDYHSSANAYSSAFKVNNWKGSAKDRYNAALAWTMARNADSAFFNLQRIADKAYFSDYEKITGEKNFKDLHKDNRWQPLIEQVKKNKLPEGWFRAGSHPASYLFSVENPNGTFGKKAVSIKSKDTKIEGFGTIMQVSDPTRFLGKRVRMSGYMKTENVADWAGFWFRVDVDSVTVSFDNMNVDKSARPVSGTTNWRKYGIVLDVPANATALNYGALLAGTGQIWLDNLNFEIVDNMIPTTGFSTTCDIKNGKKPKSLLPEPLNLSFEE